MEFSCFYWIARCIIDLQPGKGLERMTVYFWKHRLLIHPSVQTLETYQNDSASDETLPGCYNNFSGMKRLGCQPSKLVTQTVVEDVVTAWQQCLAWPGLFPVIKPSRMSAGYPSLLPHQCCPILHLLTHTFHTENSSFLRSHGEEMLLAPGRGCLVSGGPLPHLSDIHWLVWPCHSPSNRSPNTSDFTLERLLSCGDCVTGPFSGSQEIPHSAEVMGGGDAQLQLSRFSNSPADASFLAPPTPQFLKIIKPPRL